MRTECPQVYLSTRTSALFAVVQGVLVYPGDTENTVQPNAPTYNYQRKRGLPFYPLSWESIGAPKNAQHHWIRFWRTLTNVSRKHLKSTSPSCQRRPSSTVCGAPIAGAPRSAQGQAAVRPGGRDARPAGARRAACRRPQRGPRGERVAINPFRAGHQTLTEKAVHVSVHAGRSSHVLATYSTDRVSTCSRFSQPARAVVRV